MREIGLTFDDLNELDTLGIIKFNPLAGFVALDVPDTGVLTYTNGITKEISKHNKDQIPLGNVILTNAGECLRRITPPVELPDYEAAEKAFMIKNGVTYKEATNYRIVEDQSGFLKIGKIQSVES